jgi:hypothetical protein
VLDEMYRCLGRHDSSTPLRRRGRTKYPLFRNRRGFFQRDDH